MVAQILAAADADTDMICAAYLHDVVEDTALTLTDIEDEFGARVARLVAGVTKATDLGTPVSAETQAALTESELAGSG